MLDVGAALLAQPVHMLSSCKPDFSLRSSVEPAAPCRLRAFTLLPKLRRAVLGVTQWKRLQYTIIIVF
jgi:hypothetical protein